MHIVVYANASEESGEGHAVRCMQLLSEFSEATITWCYRKLTPRVEQLLLGRGYALRYLGCSPDEVAGSLKRTLIKEHFQLVIIDDYEIDLSKRLTETVTVVFDDLANRKMNVDLLIDASPLRQQSDYDNWVCCNTRCLLGASYLMLEDGLFAANRKVINRGHLFLGSTDPLCLTLPYIDLLLTAAPDWVWEVVVTAKTPFLDEIRMVADAAANIVLNFEPSTLTEGLSKAEVAIGAPGTTTWQRLAAGCRVALVATNCNQITILKSLEDKGYIDYWGYGMNEQTVRNQLSCLLSNTKTYESMDLDAGGALRIKQSIEELL